MSDTYQAIYDAARQRIQGGSVQDAIENAFRDSGFSHYAQQAFSEFQFQASNMSKPSVLMRPALTLSDGGVYWAEYGDCKGIGDTPAEAMAMFDRIWVTK
jgi:hypothetical protein